MNLGSACLKRSHIHFMGIRLSCFRILVAAAILCCNSFPMLASSAGGWSGNGGEPIRMANNVWFINQEQIPYCILAADSYPMPAAELSRLVRSAFDKWISFFTDYGIDGLGRSFFPAQPFVPHDSKLRMTLKFFEVPCASADTPFAKEKLRFQFGLTHPLIEAYRTFNPEEPLGLAMKKSADGRGLMNHGYIWIDRFTADPLRIEHVLLHEIGHVLGMPHNSVYVMDEDVATHLSEGSQAALGMIQTLSWPYRLQTNARIGLSLEAYNRTNIPTQGRSCQENPLLTALIRDLDLPARPCYDVGLRTTQMSSEAIQIQLEFTSEDRVTIYQGSFQPLPVHELTPKGPKFFTILPGEKKWRAQVFDPIPVSEAWQGNIVGYGRPLAAQLTMAKGIILHLHVPTLNKWITLRSRS